MISDEDLRVFKEASSKALQVVAENPIEAPEPSIFGGFFDKFTNYFKLNAKLNPRQAATNIYAAIKLIDASGPYIISGEQGRRFAKLLSDLQSEYISARNAALATNAPSYSISDKLRQGAQTLNEAIQLIKKQTAALNTFADLISGATSLLNAMT